MSIIAVKAPLVVEQQVVAPRGAAIAESEVRRAPHELVDRPEALMAADVPSLLDRRRPHHLGGALLAVQLDLERAGVPIIGTSPRSIIRTRYHRETFR